MKKNESDIPSWIVWVTVVSVLLISLGIFIVGKFHHQLGTILLVIGGILFYISVITLVFNL
ncbi:MAG: hypothetical protein J4428_02745 [Candidatus Aenigmarchaeota archaeon]|nr:hypothetical protein [Candidatus Aenigmarchaeota archaeon]